jgi:RNase H-like domain found in reverse transcriptase
MVDSGTQLITFWSRKPTDVETRHETHDAELLAIVAALKHWGQYLEGYQYNIPVLCGHATGQPATFYDHIATEQQAGTLG